MTRVTGVLEDTAGSVDSGGGVTQVIVWVGDPPPSHLRVEIRNFNEEKNSLPRRFRSPVAVSRGRHTDTPSQHRWGTRLRYLTSSFHPL